MAIATREIDVALAGNPNTGKTTLFNALTGKRQHVGNWPGTSVDRREGRLVRDERRLRVVDLPGAYSLLARSPDQAIAIDALLRDRPDVVVDVVDASNLERNLYLVLQLLEHGQPLVLALNMADVAGRRGIRIDTRVLAEQLGAAVVPTVASRARGVSGLVEAVAAAVDRPPAWRLDYGPAIEDVLQAITERLEQLDLPDHLRRRWVALSALEGDDEGLWHLRSVPAWAEFMAWVRSRRAIWEQRLGDDPGILVAEYRYAYIRDLVAAAVRRPAEDRETRSDRVDRVLTRPWTGLPIFAAVLYAAFQLIFLVAQPVVDGLDAGIGLLRELGATGLAAWPLPDWVTSLLVDGALAGAGAVVIFLPNIVLLFAALAILEDSGYLARAAYLMERLLRRAGLSGAAFVPMMLGFGCSVPAVMATRVLSDRRERLTTILVTPFMSCSARLPVYVLIAGVVFPDHAALALLALYALGVAAAFSSGLLFRRTVLRGPTAPFILELPSYHLPTLRTAGLATWQRTRAFIVNAGTYILLGSLLIWLLGSMPWGVEFSGPSSWIGLLGRWLEPLLGPLGFGWREGVALVIGFMAKELVLGGLGVLYGGAAGIEGFEEGALQVGIASAISPAAAAAFLVFVLLYVPCFAAVATIRSETGSWRWTLFQVAYSLSLAWLAALVVYQVARVLGFG